MLRKSLIKTKSNKKKNVLIILLVLAVFALLLLTLEKTRVTNLIGIDGLLINSQKEEFPEEVNYGPSTEQEKQETEDHKDKLTDGSSQPTKSADGLNVVTPIISFVDTESVNAYIPSIFEENGTCTATLTNGSTSISRQSKGFGNASYTQCEPIDIAGTGVDSGWKLKLNYESAKSKGASEIVTIP